MPAREILELGDPLLRAVSCPVSQAVEATLIFQDLGATLHEFRRAHGFGRGISAVQIGEPKRLIYIEFEGVAYCLRNPEIRSRTGDTFRLWDDCFSFPHLMVYLERAVGVTVAWENEQGRERIIEARGPLSELLQHEIDHLDGVLAVDRAIDRDSLCTRAEYLRRFRQSSS